MAGIRKHGAHRFDLSLAALAAGSAVDTSNVFPFDGFAEGATTATGYAFPFDLTSEEVFEAVYTVDTTLTGQATNFASICFRLIRAAAVLNDLRVVYSSAGVVTPAFTLANLNVASGAVVPGAGTGVLLVQAGSVLPWTLQSGDILQLIRISNNATGLATPAIGLNFTTRQKGS